MARLIDDDKLIHALCKDYTTGKKTLGQVIDEQPTAFDVDKVVEQLENRSALARPVGWSKAYEIIMLKDAIEIVKEGGVE